MCYLEFNNSIIRNHFFFHFFSMFYLIAEKVWEKMGWDGSGMGFQWLFENGNETTNPAPPRVWDGDGK